jgi:hypothetical protein
MTISSFFKRELLINIGKTKGGTVTRKISNSDEKTIDFIDLLFQAIAKDNSISDIFFNLLMHLKIPLIKISMIDEMFFKNASHPARNTLNLLAWLGKGINEIEDPIYLKCEKVINQLNEDFDMDIISFQKAVDSLNEIINTEKSLSKENEQQTQKHVLQEHARKIVLEELRRYFKGKTLPKPAHPIVLRHWPTLMFHRYIRFGKGSEEWNETINLLRLLLKSIQPINNDDTWSSLKNNHMGIISTLKGTLQKSKQSKESINRSIEGLGTCYKEILDTYKSSDSNIDIEDNVSNTDSDNPFSYESIMTKSNQDMFEAQKEDEIKLLSAREKISKLPKEVQVGSWFEIYTGKDSVIRRLKLSIILSDDATLIFVNSMGKKVMEKDAEIFTNELADKKSNLIADHSIFDYALSSVINSLSFSKAPKKHTISKSFAEL